MKKATPWLYVIAVMIFSLLLVAYAHDQENQIPVGRPTTQTGMFDTLMWVAKGLGFKRSILVALLATGLSIYAALNTYKNNEQ